MALSDLHPALYRVSVLRQCLQRDLADFVASTPFAYSQTLEQLPHAVVRHQSLLRRRLGDSDPHLQETKVVNLRLAAATIDGLLIQPGQVFSFWRRVGPPVSRRGYLEGLVLGRGEIRTAVGGGLCQLSNLLYWMALHTPLTIVEHHHHGFDPFPDDRRTLPFGSGATVFYNYGDLRFRNDTRAVVQIRLWLTDQHLRGEIAVTEPWAEVYHVFERNHRFVRGDDGRIYRENEIWRRVMDRVTGLQLREELISRNHSLVKYAWPASTGA